MLKINNLQVKLEEEDKQILKGGVDLEVPAGAVHAIMGPMGRENRHSPMCCRAATGMR